MKSTLLKAEDQNTRIGKINKSGGLSKQEKKKIKDVRNQRKGACRGRVW